MESWLQLGEGCGYVGDKLEIQNISCPFCKEQGNFKQAFHAEKKKPDSEKNLNFDTFECGNCGDYIMVVWSSSDCGFGRSLHDYCVLPCYRQDSIP